MKIFFINPPFLGRFSRAQRSPGIIKSGTMYYPYWLAHAAAVVDEAGHEINLIDCPAAGKTEEELHKAVQELQPDLMVLESVTASWYSDLEVAANLKKLLPNSKICIAGTHVTAMWKESLEKEPAVDFVAIGEYDFTIQDIVDELEKESQDFSIIPGIAYRDGERAVRKRRHQGRAIHISPS